MFTPLSGHIVITNEGRLKMINPRPADGRARNYIFQATVPKTVAWNCILGGYKQKVSTLPLNRKSTPPHPNPVGLEVGSD